MKYFLLTGLFITLGIIYQFKQEKTLIINIPVPTTDYRKVKMQNLLETIYNQDMSNFTIFTTSVTVTAYTATKEECNNEPWLTANGKPSRIGVAAISRDMRLRLGVWMGDMIYLEGLGMFIVADQMSTHKRKYTKSPIPITMSIDILVPSKKAAKLFGVKENVTMTYIR